jgi:AbrB family looped-hinge helix DNA binding protein
MAVRTTKVTRKGQITIPIEFREKYNLKEGARVLVEDRDGRLTIQHPDQVVDWTAGALAHYAKGVHLTPEEMREIAARSIADEVMAEMEEIDRERTP